MGVAEGDGHFFVYVSLWVILPCATLDLPMAYEHGIVQKGRNQ